MLKRHNILFSFLILSFLVPLTANAINPSAQVRFHCESDTIKIDSILSDISSKHLTTREALPLIAESFLDTPYVPNTLEDTVETLTVDVDGFDCMTFVETSMAMAKSATGPRPSWREMAEELKKLRYRRGEINGYASRLHYVSDWIGQNVYNGNIKELTSELGQEYRLVKSLDYMTNNRDLYPALADSATFEAMKMVEMGFRAHKVPYLKREFLSRKDVINELRDGDIIAVVTKDAGLDVCHMGLVKFVDGKPHLLHASKSAGKVEVTQLPLNEYVKSMGRQMVGVRVLRIEN